MLGFLLRSQALWHFSKISRDDATKLMSVVLVRLSLGKTDRNHGQNSIDPRHKNQKLRSPAVY